VVLGLNGDSWKEPAALERLRAGSGWNGSAELRLNFEPWGIALKGGSKSAGFFPGLPPAKGSYLAAGVTYRVDVGRNLRTEPPPRP